MSIHYWSASFIFVCSAIAIIIITISNNNKSSSHIDYVIS